MRPVLFNGACGAAEKPVWSGKSETWEPGSDQQIIDDVVKVVVESLGKQGLLPEK